MRIARTRSAAERPVTIILLAVAVIALALFVAACGGSTTSTTGGNTTTSSSSATTGGAGGGTSQVIMKNRAFDPATGTIRGGDRGVGTKKDAPQHDGVAEGGALKSDFLNLGGLSASPSARPVPTRTTAASIQP